MVQVESCVPGGHVLGQSVICSKDVVCPGPDISSVLLNYPRAPIIQPWLTPWEEVKTHVHHPRRRDLVRNGLRPRCSFRLHQVAIEIWGHQELGSVRSIHAGRRNILYG